MEIRLSDDREYLHLLQRVKDKIRNGKLSAALAVNKEMLQVMWDIGAALSEKQSQSSWGDKIITQLAQDLSVEFGAKGYSPTQLKYMRRWYQFYNPVGLHSVDQLKLIENEKLTFGLQPVDQNPNEFPLLLGKVPWGHHIQIFTKSSSIEEAYFYLNQTIKNNWARKMLVYQMESGLFHRKGRAITNFEQTMPKVQSELASELFKNPYQLEFLELVEDSSERELENAIINNIIRFLQELGPSFALIGRQYHLQVSENDYFIDLLFYHTRLHCYLVIELKVTDFKPEFLGKLEFYITAVDEKIKMPEDHPTIGLLLCKTADEVIVEYSLRSKTKPIGVAEYQHALPKELSKELPTVADLRKELSKEIVIHQKPVEVKLDRLRQIIDRINTEEAKQGKDEEIIIALFDKMFLPLTNHIRKRCESIKDHFQRINLYYLLNNGTTYVTDEPLESQLNKNNAHSFTVEKIPTINSFEFHLNLYGFKKGGLEAFDIHHTIEVSLEKYRFEIRSPRNRKIFEKLYHQLPNHVEIEEWGDQIFDMILEEIEEKISRIFPEINEME